MPSGPERELCADCRSILNWTADSKAVMVAAGQRDYPVLFEVSTGRRTVLADHPKYPIHDFVLSPDRRWMAFKLVISGTAHPVYISPVREEAPASEPEWIRITGDFFHSKPFWSADGNMLFFYSIEDGSPCLYARRLDPTTKRPVGETVAVRHFHGNLRPLAPHLIGVGFAGDRLFLPLWGGKGSIWIAEPVGVRSQAR
jgi:Tol biopolymer transport system component